MSHIATMLDVSNYSGPLDSQVLASLDFEVLCVRLSLETPAKRSLARQQLRAGKDAGKILHGYGWSYWDEDPAAYADRWYNLGASIRSSMAMIWIDAEDKAQGFSMKWLQAAFRRLDQHRQGNGLYTGKWYWTLPQVGDPRDLAPTRSLWLAQYDGIPDLEQVDLFGGWDRADAKQYLGNSPNYPFICDESVVVINDD